MAFSKTAAAPRFISPRVVGVLLVFALSALLAAVFAVPAWRENPILFAILGVLYFYAISVAVSGSYDPLYLAIGADGMLSVSKCQFLLWNATVAFAYLWIFAVRATHGASLDALDIPRNVLYAMGFSIGTLAAAKGITVSYINAGRIAKPSQSPASAGAQDLVSQDNGTTPDLTKIQMLIWTVIAIVVYLVKVTYAANAGASVLPDIDVPLLVLMGLGQAAYLGNKLTSSDVPVLTSLSQSAGAAGTSITVNGTNLWGEVVALFNGQPDATGTVTAVPSGGTSFTATIPQKLGGVALTAGSRVDVSVIVDGITSANTLPFTVTG